MAIKERLMLSFRGSPRFLKILLRYTPELGEGDGVDHVFA